MFKIKNRFLSGLVQWLQLQSLSGKESRERTRFVKICQDRLKEVNEFYTGIIDKFVTKDEKGHYKTKEKDGQKVYTFPNHIDEERYLKEINELHDEEFKLELTELNKEMLDIIGKIVLDTDYRFGPKDTETIEQKQMAIGMANNYFIWCKLFEQIKN